MKSKRQMDTNQLLLKENPRTKVLQLSIGRNSVGRVFLSLPSYFVEQCNKLFPANLAKILIKPNKDLSSSYFDCGSLENLATKGKLCSSMEL